MPNDLVSVIIPLYNRADKIEVTINSVLTQLYSNIEIIIVDDGSIDNPSSKIGHLLSDKILLITQENSGACRARNNGVEYASGKYIAFLDSDDLFEKDHISSSIESIRNDESSICYCQVYAKRSDCFGFFKPSRGIRDNENVAEYLLCESGFIQTSTLFMLKSVFDKVKFNESLKAGQDTDFAIRAYNFGFKFKMKANSSVIWEDSFDPLRISSTPHPRNRINWLNSIKNEIPSKAYYSDLGWHCAKALFRQGFFAKLQSIGYFLLALFKGCYSFKSAIKIFLQIVFPKKEYQKIADFFISKGVKQ
jgi:glycosyltransferase involved in cell wall biosynthesis